MALMMSRKKSGANVFSTSLDIGYGSVTYNLTDYTHLQIKCTGAIQYIGVVGILNGTQLFSIPSGQAASVDIEQNIPANSTLVVTCTGDGQYITTHHRNITITAS